MNLLLTNDDGVDSPALVPFAAALEESHDVTVAVPDGERSWIGKAISRHEPITLERAARDGVELHTTSGTPADAVQLGVHHLDGPTDLVVSGINLGFNHGAAFMLSSGTVGAALEGWIAGVPAVAFSTGTWGGDFRSWHRDARRESAAPQWKALAVVCTQLLAEVLDSGILDTAHVVSINVPYEATPATRRRVTRLARIGYGSLYGELDDGRFEHQRVEYVPREDLAGTDIEAAGEDVVTITPIRVPASPDLPDHVRTRLERPTT